MTDTLEESQTIVQASIEARPAMSESKLEAEPEPEAIATAAETEEAVETAAGEEVVEIEADAAAIEESVDAEAAGEAESEEAAEALTQAPEAEVVEAVDETAAVGEAVEEVVAIQAVAAPDPLAQVRELLFGEAKFALETKLERARTELSDRIAALEARMETDHAAYFGMVTAIMQLGASVQNLNVK